MIGFTDNSASHTQSGVNAKKSNRSKRIDPSLLSGIFDMPVDNNSEAKLKEKKNPLEDYLINDKVTS